MEPAYSDGDDGSEEGAWEDWNEEGAGGEEDGEPARSLFCDKMLGSPEEAMRHDAAEFNFDLREFIVQQQLDEYDVFRCINWIRRRVLDGVDPRPDLDSSAQQTQWRGNDEFLKPVLEDDALLFHDYEDIVASWRAQGSYAGLAGPAAVGRSATMDELQRLRDENEALRESLARLAASCLPEELKEEPPSQPSEPSTSGRVEPAKASGGVECEAPPSATPGPARPRAAPLSASAREVDGSYFDSYGGLGIHQEMISDKPRTDAYQRALECNPGLVKGKVVLDVGCGTGILSLFACRAGASRVVSVEANERMAGFARKVAEVNGYSSDDGGPMTVVHGKLEDLDTLPVDQVDVLVSEWMGYALLFETMLDSVLQARNRFLRPEGAMLPDRVTLHVAGASAGATGVQFWKNVYGFDMSPIGDEVRLGEMRHANVHVVQPADIVTSTAQIKELDLSTMRADEQDFSADFTLECAAASSSSSPVECHAIVLWFEAEFSARYCKEAPARLSTSVYEQATHWAQTVLVLQEPVALVRPEQQEGAGDAPFAGKLSGRLSMVRNKHKHRFLDISLEYRAELGNGRLIEHASLYSMAVVSSE